MVGWNKKTPSEAFISYISMLNLHMLVFRRIEVGHTHQTFCAIGRGLYVGEALFDQHGGQLLFWKTASRIEHTGCRPAYSNWFFALRRTSVDNICFVVSDPFLRTFCATLPSSPSPPSPTKIHAPPGLVPDRKLSAGQQNLILSLLACLHDFMTLAVAGDL